MGATSVAMQSSRNHCPQHRNALLFAKVGLVLMSSSTPAGPLQFLSETIDVTVQEDHCTITGDYFLANETNAPGGCLLYYPFPIDSGLPLPDSISVTDLATRIPIRYAKVRDGIQFPVQIAPLDSTAFRVTYVQRTPERRTRYILSTTKRWGTPLRSADFLIRIPQGLELARISLAPDSLEHAGTWQIYRIHRSQFMPACDLDLTWKEVE